MRQAGEPGVALFCLHSGEADRLAYTANLSSADFSRPHASVGASIVVVALAIGTFVQQTLKYEAFYLSTQAASLPIAQSIDGTNSGWAPMQGGTYTKGVNSEVRFEIYIYAL